MSTAPRQRRTAKRGVGPLHAPAATEAGVLAHGNDAHGWPDSPRQLKQSTQITQLQTAAAAQGGLPDGLRQGIESLSGMDMSGVRVHRNSAKAAALGAHAYAQGTNIHLGPGQEKHLPHEAWHVVQQHQGRVAPTHQVAGVAVNSDTSLEREADAMGSRAVSIAQRAVRSTTEGTVQRRAAHIDKSPVMLAQRQQKVVRKRRDLASNFPTHAGPASVQETAVQSSGPPAEADSPRQRMLSEQIAQLVGRAAASAAPLPGGPVAQTMRIMRKGVIVEVGDDYAIQADEHRVDDDLFSAHPSVTVARGTQTASADDSGAFKTSQKRKPPTHKELQRSRSLQGAETRERLKGQSLSDVEDEVERMRAAAEEVEDIAGGFLPKNHSSKIQKLHAKGTVTGPAFRSVAKDLDEVTQSQATSSYMTGYGRSGGDTPPHYSGALHDFGEQTLRLMSSVRLPTTDVVAPVAHGGSTTGQQHPTSRDQPKLSGGSSGHAYADRERVESQVRAHNVMARDPQTRPSDLVLGPTLAATVATLSSMSAPLAASNVPAFNGARHGTQGAHRGTLKDQGVSLSERLGLETAQESQDRDAPWKPWSYPISPTRKDKDSDDSDSDS